MPRDNYYAQPRGRSRSPLRPVQSVEIYEDQETKGEDWAADKENLYNQLEKLTLRLDTVNSLVASQTIRIADLEKCLKEKEILVGEYQKRVRENMTDKKDAYNKTEQVVETCEKFKDEVIKLSHELHYMQTTMAISADTCRLYVRCKKLRLERDAARDKLAEVLKEKGGSLIGWPSPEERVIKNEYDD